jgi:hypothetical protein
MQGEYAATSGYHSDNADVGKTEEQMAEATTGALANLATATAADRGVMSFICASVINHDITKVMGH